MLCSQQSAQQRCLTVIVPLLKCTTHHLTVLTSTLQLEDVGLHKHSASGDECQSAIFFLHGGIQLLTFASYTLLSQMPFCRPALLLPSVTQQQNVLGYWQEGSTSAATPPTSTSDIMGQHNKTGGITFGAALIFPWVAS